LIDRKGLYYAMWRQQVGEGRAARAIAGSSPNPGALATPRC
jgi:hypothetical protein